MCFSFKNKDKGLDFDPRLKQRFSFTNSERVFSSLNGIVITIVINSWFPQCVIVLTVLSYFMINIIMSSNSLCRMGQKKMVPCKFRDDFW